MNFENIIKSQFVFNETNFCFDVNINQIDKPLNYANSCKGYDRFRYGMFKLAAYHDSCLALEIDTQSKIDEFQMAVYSFGLIPFIWVIGVLEDPITKLPFIICKYANEGWPFIRIEQHLITDFDQSRKLIKSQKRYSDPEVFIEAYYKV